MDTNTNNVCFSIQTSHEPNIFNDFHVRQILQSNRNKGLSQWSIFWSPSITNAVAITWHRWVKIYPPTFSSTALSPLCIASSMTCSLLPQGVMQNLPVDYGQIRISLTGLATGSGPFLMASSTAHSIDGVTWHFLSTVAQFSTIDAPLNILLTFWNQRTQTLKRVLLFAFHRGLMQLKLMILISAPFS